MTVHSSIHLWIRIPIDSNSIFASWGEQLFTGGNPVEKYAIEWSSDEAFNTNWHSEEPKVFGRIELTNDFEVQCIHVHTAAEDVTGYFVIHFRGETSSKIYVNSSEVDVKDALESISAVEGVRVTMFTVDQSQTYPRSYFEKEWMVTFTNLAGNMPSLLVDTGIDPPSSHRSLQL